VTFYSGEVGVASAIRSGPRLAVLMVLVLAGCGGASPEPAPSRTPSPIPLPVVASACPDSPVLEPTGVLPERRGVGSKATLSALLFAGQGDQVKANQEIKIVWRMTGSGELAMTAEGPNGARVRPSWGPEAHGGSNYERPGEEWGVGWVFPTPGCWTIRATRSVGTGYLALRVAA
jgi:hypothetical protein